MFSSILIANRGEIAVRLIRACHEMGIEAVVVYSSVDAHALHVRMGDRAGFLGLPSPADSYLNGPKIIETALATGCQAIHPGYGFLAESPDFAEAVIAAGLAFIGPPPQAIRRMGLKAQARTLMETAGVPVVPGFHDNPASDEDFRHAAQQIGYPVIVKASAGGGGKGMRIAQSPADLSAALDAARHEADHAFGDPAVFLEKYIERGRHIEVQVLADQHGHTVHLFERECSIQRRHQKIIEESPSPLITPEMRRQIGQAAVDAARAVGYINAGTVELIAEPNGKFYFMEMNTRLQVEHPVTELVTGLDLPQLQIRIAAGEPLPFTQDELTQRGHAIECRLYAEDPAAGFLPAIGPVLKYIEPGGPGVRVDSGISTGDEVTVYYDPLLAKVIVHAEHRSAAIRRMREALRQTILLGVTTNLAFLRAVIEHPVFAAGDLSTHFIDEHLADWQPDRDPPDLALIAVALAQLNQAAPQSTAADSQGDVFSPWGRTDSFRTGRPHP